MTHFCRAYNLQIIFRGIFFLSSAGGIWCAISVGVYKQDELFGAPHKSNGKSPNNLAVLDEKGNMLFKSRWQN